MDRISSPMSGEAPVQGNTSGKKTACDSDWAAAGRLFSTDSIFVCRGDTQSWLYFAMVRSRIHTSSAATFSWLTRGAMALTRDSTALCGVALGALAERFFWCSRGAALGGCGTYLQRHRFGSFEQRMAHITHIGGLRMSARHTPL